MASDFNHRTMSSCPLFGSSQNALRSFPSCSLPELAFQYSKTASRLVPTCLKKGPTSISIWQIAQSHSSRLKRTLVSSILSITACSNRYKLSRRFADQELILVDLIAFAVISMSGHKHSRID